MLFRSLTALASLTALLAACGAPQTIVETAPAPAPAARSGPRSLQRDARTTPNLQLPPSARQLQEGYWLGAMIGPEHIAALRAIGVRVVLSAVAPSEQTRALLDEAGIDRVDVPMGSNFRHEAEILATVDRYAPEEIFIHCRHGADRTGAIAAYVLTVRHGWALADALYSVIYESQSDLDGLAALLLEAGIDDVRTLDDASVGFYSVSAAGGFGGLKARNARYGRLVATTIAAVRALGY